MFESLQSLLGPAVMTRVTLLINHVLAAEPAALERLRPHVGKRLQIEFRGWPTLLPPWPPTAFLVTPAALLEWCGDAAPGEPDLRVSIDASNPAKGLLQALTGERPQVEVAGDAALATTVNWLFDNLRWDLQNDLARIVGVAPAHELARLGGAIGDAMRRAARSLGSLAARAGQPRQ